MKSMPSEQLQSEMLAFFLRTSAPRLLKKLESKDSKKEGLQACTH